MKDVVRIIEASQPVSVSPPTSVTSNDTLYVSSSEKELETLVRSEPESSKTWSPCESSILQLYSSINSSGEEEELVKVTS